MDRPGCYQEFENEQGMVGNFPSPAARIEMAVGRFQQLLLILILVWLGCELTALAGIVTSPIRLCLAGGNPFFTSGLASFAILYVWSSPRSREMVVLAILGLCLVVGLKLLASMSWWQGCGTGMGLACLTGLCWRTWTSTGFSRTQALSLLLPACMGLIQTALSTFFLDLTVQVRPDNYDAFVYAADGSLGMQASFLFGQLFKILPPFLPCLAGVIYITP
jgi:hypothetical protein